MNLHIIEGNWQQAKGRIQEEWGDQDFDHLVVLIGKDEADGQVVDIDSLFENERRN